MNMIVKNACTTKASIYVLKEVKMQDHAQAPQERTENT